MSRYRLLLLISFIALFSISGSLTAHAQDVQTTHVVESGENLFRIALRYGVTMDALIAANNITDPSRILRGQTLTIPGVSIPDSGTEIVNPLVASAPTIHVVQPGETLGSIATLYGVTVEQLIQSNNIANPNRILRGQELNVWTVNTDDPAALIPETSNNIVEPPAPPPTQIHIVQSGEHLAQIAQQYGISWPVIAQLNGITDPNRVFAGQELLIPALNPDGGIADLGILDLQPLAPNPTNVVGKQIVVDLSDSRIYAYEDGQLLRTVVVSTGLPATPTVQGDYQIYVKYDAQTMSGPGYYLPGVPWVMYFYQGYGIHGTYWHNNFGQPMSHGCVNLPTPEAEWFYNFAPVGTPVHVQA